MLIIVALSLAGCSSESKDASKSDTSKKSDSSKTADTSKDGKTNCGEELLDPSKKYQVVFETSKGSFTVDLDVKNAPISTAHLASLVEAGFYDGLIFHRVVPDFVIQGGDPLGNGSGSSDCSVVSEEPPRPYKQGDFAWAKSGAEPAGTAGSQFFIVTGADDAPSVEFLGSKQLQDDGTSKINYGYGGTVSEGLEVALAIEDLAPATGDGEPTEKVTILSAKLKSI